MTHFGVLRIRLFTVDMVMDRHLGPFTHDHSTDHLAISRLGVPIAMRPDGMGIPGPTVDNRELY